MAIPPWRGNDHGRSTHNPQRMDGRWPVVRLEYELSPKGQQVAMRMGFDANSIQYLHVGCDDPAYAELVDYFTWGVSHNAPFLLATEAGTALWRPTECQEQELAHELGMWWNKLEGRLAVINYDDFQEDVQRRVDWVAQIVQLRDLDAAEQS